MKQIVYNKLVRDNIEAKILSKGEACEVRVLSDDNEFIKELKNKVIEEASELAKTSQRADFIAEYADLMIVLDVLTKQLEISPAEIQVALAENLEKKGKFDKRHFLLWSEDKNNLQ